MHKFKQNIINTYGKSGEKWLKSLPELIQIVAAEWGLSELKPFHGLTQNYLLGGYKDNQRIVLKLTINPKDLLNEIATLSLYDGNSSIVLLGHNLGHGAILLQCAKPGSSLKSFFPDNEETAINIASQIIEQLHSKSLKINLSQEQASNNFKFQTVENYLTILNTNLNLPQAHIDKAKKLGQHLLDTTTKEVVLHGDLHHLNILLHEKTWLAIDPKGVIGDPCYEVGAFVRNPYKELLKEPHIEQIITQRINIFSDLLNFDAQRCLEWSYVQCVLAAAWATEDKVDESPWIQIADIITAKI